MNSGPLTWTATFSEPVTGVATSNFSLTTSGLTGTPSISGVSAVGGSPSATWTVSVSVAGVSGSNTGSIRLNLARRGSVVDPAGNTLRTNSLNGQSYTYDTTKPTISGGVSSPLSNGRYKAGQLIPVTVTFSEAVTVGGAGTPQLTLATGSPATAVGYTSGSGTTTLTFDYTVAPGHASTDLDYTTAAALILNSGAITDAAGNTATLTLPNPGAAGSLGANKALVIDTTAPTITGVTSGLANGTYVAGQVVPVAVSFSEAVTVTGAPQLALATGSPATTAANLTSGSGTTTLTFSYTVVAGNNSLDLDYASTGALTLNGGRIADAALNDATLTLPTPGAAGSLSAGKALVIDAAPSVVTVTSVNGSARTFPFTTGADVDKIGGTCGTAVGDAATVSPRINGNPTTPATATCSSGLWTLTLGTPLSTNGTRTLSATQQDAAGNIGTAPPQTLIIDKAPPTVSSIVRAGASQLVNSGPLAWTVTFSEPVSGLAPGNFILPASGLTGTPTISSVVAGGPVPSATWTVTVGMGGVNGTNAGSIGLNLTSAGSVVDAVGNAMGAGTTTGQTYSYDTTAPTVTGVSSPLANGSYGAGQVVPVTVTFGEPVTVTGTPRLTLATGPSATTAVDYTAGTGGTTLTFEYTVQDGDNTADLDYAATDALALDGGTIRDAAGNAATLALPTPGSAPSLAGAKDLVIDTTPPEVVVDDIGSFSFFGLYFIQVTGTAEVGSGPVTVHLCLNSGSPCDAGAATRTFTGLAVDASGAWQTNWTNMGVQGNWYASATQTDAVGNVGTSEVLGPIPN